MNPSGIPVTHPCSITSTTKNHAITGTSATNTSTQKTQTKTVMKTYLPYSLILAAAASGMAFGAETAYTTPVGYVTQALAANQFTLAGLTVQQPTKAAGILDAESATSVTDNEVNFTTSLTAGATYILELPDGTVQEITAWSGSVLTTPSNITAFVVPGTTTYKLRKAATVSDVFGATNTVAALTSGTDASLCDKILIPNAANGFDTVFYFNDGAGAEGWLDGDSNLAADKPMPYMDGFYVQRVAGAAKSLTISGEVKTKPTGGVLVAGFNYLNSVAPVGLTLDGSNLKSFVSQGTDGATVDNVLLPTALGGYTTCFYFNDGAGAEGWLDGDSNLAGGLLLEDGFLILNRGAVKPYTLSVPTSYSSL